MRQAFILAIGLGVLCVGAPARAEDNPACAEIRRAARLQRLPRPARAVARPEPSRRRMASPAGPARTAEDALTAGSKFRVNAADASAWSSMSGESGGGRRRWSWLAEERGTATGLVVLDWRPGPSGGPHLSLLERDAGTQPLRPMARITHGSMRAAMMSVPFAFGCSPASNSSKSSGGTPW